MKPKFLTALLPSDHRPVRILRGPFRGARMMAIPRSSMRQILGLYEHEMNDWLEKVLPRVNKVLDVGANEGYFTFGCAAAFRRLHTPAEIHAFEPEPGPRAQFEASISRQSHSNIKIHLHPCHVSNATTDKAVTLDDFARDRGEAFTRNALVKIDVEGAELDVIESASMWLNATNYFLIEVHFYESSLDKLRNMFSRRGLTLAQVDQKPLPIIGREDRGTDLWWLVSAL